MKCRYTLEAQTGPMKVEDGGQAGILEVSNESKSLFVRLHTFYESCVHPELTFLEGRKIRVTVETID